MLNLYSNTRKDGIFMNRRANSSYFHEAGIPTTVSDVWVVGVQLPIHGARNSVVQM